MTKHFFKQSEINFLSLMFLLFFACAGAQADAADDDCQESGGYGFVCGPQNAEDLVLVPGTKWIISSGMAPGAAITLIDSQEKYWSELYPADSPRVQQNMELYGACPGLPDPDNFITHGMSLRPGENGRSTLYVVSHGGREAIEIFDVYASSARPVITWTGCVLMPQGMVANSVVSLSDGSLLVTVPLHPDKTIADAFAGEPTGAVYEWSPGDSEFEMVQGTELPYCNGIEVSADEQEIYVVSSGLFTIVAYTHSNPARQLRSTKPMAIVPDNIHMSIDGRLITAGMVIDDPTCGGLQDSGEFVLEEFATCARPFIARAIDPQSMKGEDLVTGPASEHFSNATMALHVGNNIWIGTFSGNRIAIFK